MDYWKGSLKENGLAVTAGSVLFGLWRRIHNAILARALPGRPSLRIHPDAHVRGLKHITLGRNFTAGRGLWLEAVTANEGAKFVPTIRIGNNVIVNDHVHIAAVHRVTIGNDVLMASRVYISDHNHGIYGPSEHSSPDIAPRLRPLTLEKPVQIGDRVWLGEMVSVLPGVTIGDGSIIGSNSVVSRDIPADVIAVGAPARVIKRYDRTTQSWIQA